MLPYWLALEDDPGMAEAYHLIGREQGIDTTVIDTVKEFLLAVETYLGNGRREKDFFSVDNGVHGKRVAYQVCQELINKGVSPERIRVITGDEFIHPNPQTLGVRVIHKNRIAPLRTTLNELLGVYP